MDIDGITEQILEESNYIESATDQGYPRYTEKEAIGGAQSIESEAEIEMLKQLSDGDTIYDLDHRSIGEAFDRLENGDMIDRPATGDTKIKLTRLSRTYLQYYEKIQRDNARTLADD